MIKEYAYSLKIMDYGSPGPEGEIKVEIHILASGSTGNAAFFRFGDTGILIDAGISARRIEKGLAEVGFHAGDLSAVLITHEHNDHIRGLDVLIRRHQIPVYTRGRTWENIPCRKDLPSHCCRNIDREFSINQVAINTVNISHDAADAVGFVFYHDRKKIVMATDIGVVTPAVEKALEMADAAVLETNHDLDMLQNGPYPRFLKQRILSSHGHLSNVSAARLLSRIKHPVGMQVFMAHLSQQNNHPDLAEKTVQDYLTSCGCVVGKDMVLNRTFPNSRTSSVL